MMNGTADMNTPINANFLPNALKAPMELRPVLRPSAVSSSSNEMPIVNTNTRYMNRNVPPPYFAARYGKRHMLPRPTADAAAASTKASLPDHDARPSVDAMMIIPFHRADAAPMRRPPFSVNLCDYSPLPCNVRGNS